MKKSTIYGIIIGLLSVLIAAMVIVIVMLNRNGSSRTTDEVVVSIGDGEKTKAKGKETVVLDPTAIYKDEDDKEVEPETETNTKTETAVNRPVYIADVYEYLTLRTEASTKAAAIALLPAFTKMTIIQQAASPMVLVRTMGDQSLQGYVNADYICLATDTPKRAGKSKPSVTAATIYYADVYESLTLRASASTSAAAVGYVEPFGAMKSLRRSGKMIYVISLATGEKGWVNRDYIVTNIANCKRAGRAMPRTSIPTGRTYYADVYDSLTVRSYASTKAPALGYVKPRGSMTFISQSGKMYKVRVDGSGLVGWVNSDYLATSAAGCKRAGRSTTQPTGKTYYADVYDELTVRSYASTKAPALGYVKPFGSMTYISRSGKMYKVRVDGSGLVGWVNSDYIATSTSRCKRAGRSKSTSTAKTYYADVYDSLTVRSYASTKAPALGYVPPFGSMTYISRSGKMYKVRVNSSGLVGWVNSDYIATSTSRCKRAGH